jgi:hypothetical protein
MLLILVALISLLSNSVLCYNYTSFEECVAAKGNQSFPSDDGCNTCGCDGSGEIMCTMRACLAQQPPSPWYANPGTLTSTEVALIVIIVVITVSIATVALIMQYIKKRQQHQQQQSPPQHSYYVKTSS